MNRCGYLSLFVLLLSTVSMGLVPFLLVGKSADTLVVVGLAINFAILAVVLAILALTEAILSKK